MVSVGEDTPDPDYAFHLTHIKSIFTIGTPISFRIRKNIIFSACSNGLG